MDYSNTKYKELVQSEELQLLVNLLIAMIGTMTSRAGVAVPVRAR